MAPQVQWGFSELINMTITIYFKCIIAVSFSLNLRPLRPQRCSHLLRKSCSSQTMHALAWVRAGATLRFFLQEFFLHLLRRPNSPSRALLSLSWSLLPRRDRVVFFIVCVADFCMRGRESVWTGRTSGSSWQDLLSISRGTGHGDVRNLSSPSLSLSLSIIWYLFINPLASFSVCVFTSFWRWVFSWSE